MIFTQIIRAECSTGICCQLCSLTKYTESHTGAHIYCLQQIGNISRYEQLPQIHENI